MICCLINFKYPLNGRHYHNNILLIHIDIDIKGTQSRLPYTIPLHTNLKESRTEKKTGY